MSQTKYWRISPGQGGFLWREQKLNECIAIGWSDIGDAKNLDKEALRRKCFKNHFTKSAADQLNDFINEVKIGDKIIASASGKGAYAVGTIIGDYEFNKELDYKHSRKVRWETTFWHPVEIGLLNLSGSLKNKFHGRSSRTIRELEKAEWNNLCDRLNEISTPFRNLGMWGGLIQSPEYENEVIILFGHMLQHLHMRIIKIGTLFPDAIIEWKKDGKRWMKQNVEFELRSSGFQCHLPDCSKDKKYMIVCWEDDWNHSKRRHFKIIALKKELEKIL